MKLTGFFIKSKPRSDYDNYFDADEQKDNMKKLGMDPHEWVEYVLDRVFDDEKDYKGELRDFIIETIRDRDYVWDFEVKLGKTYVSFHKHLLKN